MGNQIPHPVTNKSVHSDGNRHFKVACASMNGMREAMEDDHVIVVNENYGLFGVFDGHCGSHCSSFCAKTLPGEIEAAGKPPLDDKVLEGITLGLDRKFREQTETAGSTCCFCIAVPHGNQIKLQVANVGDSRILVGRTMGETCVPMTTDHKPSLKEERQRIEDCGGTVSADRVDGMLAMSRAIGDYEYKQGTEGELKQKVIALPDVTSLVCDSDDFVFIACDGIFEVNFTNEEVVEFLRSALANDPDDLIGACCAVADEALRRGSNDNITCLLLRFQPGSGYASKQFLPGRFYPNKPAFAKAYIATLQTHDLTLGHALELRYDLIRKKMAERIAQLKKDDDSHEGQDGVLSQLTEEMAMYKPAPGKALSAAERSAYFQKLADSVGSTVETAASAGGGMNELTMQQMMEILKGQGGASEFASLLRAKGPFSGGDSSESSPFSGGVESASSGGNQQQQQKSPRSAGKASKRGGTTNSTPSTTTTTTTTTTSSSSSSSASSGSASANAKTTPRGAASGKKKR